MATSNYKITRITSIPTRDLVGFYNGNRLIRFVSMVKDVSITAAGYAIVLESSGLPNFEFDVSNLTDIDGTAYSPISPNVSQSAEAYATRLATIMTQLSTIFKGCCSTSSGGGGQDPLQFQDEGVNIGAAGQYTNINFAGDVAVSETSPDTVEINIGVGSQASIQFQDEGSNLGSAGSVNHFNVVGQMHKATRSGNTITHTAPSVGENLTLPSLDPANSLSVQLGALDVNEVSWTTTGKQNNLSLTGWNDTWNGSTGAGKATIINYSGTAYAICSGVVGGYSSRNLIINNQSNKLVILENESIDSSTANRFRTIDGLAVFLMPNETAHFIYYADRWNLINKQRWDAFDDYPGYSGTTTQGSSTFYFNGLSTTSSGLNSQQMGILSAAPAAAARSYILSNWNGGYSVIGTSTPSLVVLRMALSASISTFGRMAIGFGSMAASAGNFYTATSGVCNGAIIGFASDSGIANAATNFFIYSGIGGAANISANGVDTGIPISNCVNNYNNFAVFYDSVNSVFDYFYSRNNGVYQFLGQTANTPTSGAGALWYEATNASRPTMWIDYTAQKTKIITTR
jgi:hypothetical protein